MRWTLRAPLGRFCFPGSAILLFPNLPSVSKFSDLLLHCIPTNPHPGKLEGQCLFQGADVSFGALEHPTSQDRAAGMDSLCLGPGELGGGADHGEAGSPSPPGTKGLTLSPPASSGEEGRAPGPDPSPGPAMTSLPPPFGVSTYYWVFVFVIFLLSWWLGLRGWAAWRGSLL